MSQPTAAATSPPAPASKSTRRGLSELSTPPAAAIPTDAAPNSTPEYTANTRPATCGGAR